MTRCFEEGIIGSLGMGGSLGILTTMETIEIIKRQYHGKGK